jgi:DNA invertase Pin-like site-specific DNA recombinase
MGKMFFNILATFAGSKSTSSACAPASMSRARARGKLKGRQQKLIEATSRTRPQRKAVSQHHRPRRCLFQSRPTVYRVLARNRAASAAH